MSFAFWPHYEWALALGVCLIAWCLGYVRPHFGFFSAALFGYLGLNSIWVWVWVENRYVTLNPYDQMAIRYFSVDSLARLFLIMVPMMYAARNRWHFRFIGEVLAGTFALFNSLWVLFTLITTECRVNNACGGAGNPSIMLGATVCMLPIIVKSWRTQWWLLLIVSLATVASHSTIAMSLLAMYYAYSMIIARHFLLAAILSWVPIVAGLVFWHSGKPFLHSGDRFKMWHYMMPMWATSRNIPFGTGWGTYHVVSLPLQSYNNKHFDIASGSHWNTLHNDFLQMLWEGGIIAASLMIIVYGASLLKMLRNYELDVAMSILLYGLYMGANPALHHAIPAVFGAWLFVYALKKDGNIKDWSLYSKQGDFYA